MAKRRYSAMDNAFRHAHELLTSLEEIYQEREIEKKDPSPKRLEALDRLIEQCSQHPAFADFERRRP